MYMYNPMNRITWDSFYMTCEDGDPVGINDA